SGTGEPSARLSCAGSRLLPALRACGPGNEGVRREEPRSRTLAAKRNASRGPAQDSDARRASPLLLSTRISPARAARRSAAYAQAKGLLCRSRAPRLPSAAALG